MARNGRFLTDLWIEHGRCGRRCADANRVTFMMAISHPHRPAVVSGSAHSGGGAFALSWIASISSWGLKVSGRPRASLALGLRAQTTFPGRRRSDYLGKFSTVRKRSPCSRATRWRSRRTRRPWCVNAASYDGQKFGALRLRFSAAGVESLRRASILVVWCVRPNPGRWSPGPSWYA